MPAGLSGPHPPAGCLGSQVLPAPGAENPECTQVTGGGLRSKAGSSVWVAGASLHYPLSCATPSPGGCGCCLFSPGKVPTPASGCRRRFQGQWQLESGWHPSPHLGDHKAIEHLTWHLHAPGAEHCGYSPFPQEAPPCRPWSQALSGRPLLSLASQAPALRLPWAPLLVMPASHPGVLCPGGSLLCSGHTYRTTLPKSASQ